MIDLQKIIADNVVKNAKGAENFEKAIGGLSDKSVQMICIGLITNCLMDYHAALQEELRKQGIEI